MASTKEFDLSKLNCVCGIPKPSKGSKYLICTQCKVVQHEICLTTTGNRSRIKLSKKQQAGYRCESCRPAEHQHLIERLNSRRQIYCDLIENILSLYLWPSYCALLSVSLTPVLVREQTMLKLDGESRDEPASFTKSWKDGLKVLLERMDAVAITRFHGRILNTKDADANIAVLKDIIVKQLVKRANKPAQYKVMAEITKLKDKGAYWKGK